MLENIIRRTLYRRCASIARITLRVNARFRDKIQSNQRKRLLRRNDDRVVFDARRYPSRRHDFQIVITGERFHRTPERAGGGVTRKIDGQDDRHP